MNLLGVNDSYAAEHTGEWTFFTPDEARALFDGLDLIKFDEEDYNGKSFSGDKHWHLFHVIARRP